MKLGRIGRCIEGAGCLGFRGGGGGGDSVCLHKAHLLRWRAGPCGHWTLQGTGHTTCPDQSHSIMNYDVLCLLAFSYTLNGNMATLFIGVYI